MLKREPIPTIPAETVRVVKAILPKGNAVTRLRDEFGAIYTDDDFAALYPPLGQPGIAPWRLALVTIFQFFENLTDRQAAQAVLTRLDWKYALSLEVTDPSFDFTVLSEFRARLIEGKAEHLLLDKMLAQFREKGLLKLRGKQRTDATHVLCSVRTLNLLELVGETFRAALNELARVVPEWLTPRIKPHWLDWFVHRVEEYRVIKGKEAREAQAVAIGQEGFDLMDALKNDPSPSVRDCLELPALKTLERVWAQQYERVEVEVKGTDDGGGCGSGGGGKEQGQDGANAKGKADTKVYKVVWRSSKVLPSDRIQSPFDPEACYGQKRDKTWIGYKVHLTECCDDDAPNLITNVMLTKASAQDMLAARPVHTHLAQNGIVPEQHFLDAGYVSADLVLQCEPAGIEIIGPMAHNSTWQYTAAQGFALDDFRIDWEKKSVTCPKKKTSRLWLESSSKQGLPIIHVEFPKDVCRKCRSKKLCTKATTMGRQLTFRPQESHQKLRARRAAQETEEWKKLYAKRAGVEGTISGAVRAQELRMARYRGTAKTCLQSVATAAGMNVGRMFNWLEGTPRAKTRTPRFAQLVLKA